ncbi:MAG: hypothetical protein WC683_18845 [bacterium]
MKGIAVMIFTALLSLAIAAPAHAVQSYNNQQFKYACTYPDGWKVKEESAKADMSSAEAAAAKSMGLEMPSMASACFGQKKCNPGDFSADPQIHLIMMEVPKAKKGKAQKETASVEKKDKKEKKGESKCEVIAQGKKSWAGSKAPYTTTRCEEKKKWRYNTTLTMMRNRGGKNYNYTLDCTMRSKSKDKAESLTEFNRDLKPMCDANVASTKLTK